MHMTSGRRGSGPHPPHMQRPMLLRSSVTEPSITPSNTIQASLISPNSPRRATDLLNKVAVYLPSGPCDLGHSIASEASDPIMIRQVRSSSVEPESLLSSGCYFSFPSFDNWDSLKREGEKEAYP